MITQTSTLAQARATIAQARSVAVLTGAGVSQESGVPTFRGPGGLWRNYRPEDLATPEAFARDPQLVWEWYAWRRNLIADTQPNPAHRALADWERCVESFLLITQNVDGLHDRAGSRNVAKLHGDIWQVRCTRCGLEERNEQVPLDPMPPRCRCGAIERPDVVWFGEPLPGEPWERAREASSRAQIFLVVGTSALVQPAASLPHMAHQAGATLLEVNFEPTPLSSLAEFSFRGKAGELLPELLGT